jgi:hypothetical protein
MLRWHPIGAFVCSFQGPHSTVGLSFVCWNNRRSSSNACQCPCWSSSRWCPCQSSSLWCRSFQSSRQPDPEGFIIPASFSSSLLVGQSHNGGYSAQLFDHNGQFELVSPLWNGGASISLVTCYPGIAQPYGGLPPSSLKRPSGGFFHESHPYGGIPYHADGVPQVVCGGGPYNGPLRHGFPHVPASVRLHHGFTSDDPAREWTRDCVRATRYLGCTIEHAT